MTRIAVHLPVVLLLLTQTASAQEWARKMFAETHHSFGTVARGAKSEYEFALTNLYKEEIHIASVRASCGCATPTITKSTLQSWEKGAIHVRFNTGSFVGQRKATITVTIDRPFYAEVQLAIDGVIRTDLMVEPGAVLFGAVDQGSTTERHVRVSYSGGSSWQITDVRSENSDLEVEILGRQQQIGRTVYDMAVRLVEPSKTGFFKSQMLFVTNDPRSNQIPVTVEGNVQSLLTVSPASLFLGVVEPGQTVTKQLVVRSKHPFRITGVKCADDCFEFSPSDEVKQLHLVPVKFTASSSPGEVSQSIEIETDQGPEVVGSCTATAKVADALTQRAD